MNDSALPKAVQRSLRIFPGGSNGEFNLPPELSMVISEGHGCELWDSNGVTYLDFSMGWGSALVGQTLRDSPIRREHGAIVLAVRGGDGEFVTNPRPDIELSENDVLVVIGEQEQLDQLREVAES